MVKMGQESLVVAALLKFARTSWKVTIYYINGALFKLNCYKLYAYIRFKNGNSASTITTFAVCGHTSGKESNAVKI